MNKKIYFNNKYILLTDEEIQHSGNQIIVNEGDLSKKEISKLIQDFIQQNDLNHVIIVSKNVNYLFEEIKNDFVFIEAAGGLITQANTYLFIYRLNKWDLPKGKLDKGESPEKAAIRECEEECAITGLKIISELPSTYHIYPYKGKFALKITYWFLMKSNYDGPLVPQTEENIEKAEWLDTNTINNTVVNNTYPSVLDLILGTIDNKK